MSEISGSCLCGKVSYKTEADPKAIINCHCTDCQKATGSVHATLLLFPEDEVSLSGSPSEFDHQADSGNTLTKIFCEKCGSQVAGRNTGRQGTITIRAGTVDQKSAVNPMMNIFCDSAIPSTPMNADLKSFPRMPG